MKSKSELFIGGVGSGELVKNYSTPLFVLDGDMVLNKVSEYTKALKKYYPNSLCCYASKALCTIGLYQLLKGTGIGFDVASGGELYTALKADIDREKIYFHGNNKTVKELTEAVGEGLHCVVVDNLSEIVSLNEIAKVATKIQKVMVRVNPGVEAHTHEFITTAKEDSKFGFSIANGAALEAVKAVKNSENLSLLGLHCHIGSQIFDVQAYELAVEKMVEFIKALKIGLNIDILELNLGGGFGIKYTEYDSPIAIEKFVKAISMAVLECVKKCDIPPPKLILEPGRSIVGEAGTTLYTVGAIKEIPGVRTFVAVDGGMFENPRYAFYGARYSATLALKSNEAKTQKVTICGKCCESGDIITDETLIQPVARGDILAVLATGAYNYSMASNYNRNAIPPMVLCKGGKHQYLVKPQTYDDILARDEELNI